MARLRPLKHLAASGSGGDNGQQSDSSIDGLRTCGGAQVQPEIASTDNVVEASQHQPGIAPSGSAVDIWQPQPAVARMNITFDPSQLQPGMTHTGSAVDPSHLQHGVTRTDDAVHPLPGPPIPDATPLAIPRLKVLCRKRRSEHALDNEQDLSCISCASLKRELVGAEKLASLRFDRLESQLGTLEGKVAEVECMKFKESVEPNDLVAQASDQAVQRKECGAMEHDEPEQDIEECDGMEHDEPEQIIEECDETEDDEPEQSVDPALQPSVVEMSLKSAFDDASRRSDEQKARWISEHEQKMALANMFVELQNRNRELESRVSVLEVTAAEAHMLPVYEQFAEEVKLKLKYLQERKKRKDNLGSAVGHLGVEVEEGLPPAYVHFVAELCLKLKHLKEEKQETERQQIAQVTGEEDSDEETDSRLCRICLDSYVNTITFPCMHFHYCVRCLTKHRKRTNTCPTCRTTISDITTPISEH